MKYDLWIKDKRSGRVHRYGSDQHDSLVIEDDGQSIIYRNLQNGESSHAWSDYLLDVKIFFVQFFYVFLPPILNIFCFC